ncbi:MAG: hypothetical protein ACREO3_09575, partial [Arenimonas sp.]
PLVIGVTSHRNLVAGELESLRAAVRGFLMQLRREYPELPLVVLSSLAEGGDQLVAGEALAIGATLVAPLPLPLDLYAQDFPDASLRDTFAGLCARASILVLPLLADNTDAAVAGAGAARDRQYAQAGVFVASHCHILLALWDGRETGLLGGTGQVVRYALDSVMPGLVEARPRDQAHLEPVDDSHVFHLACSRQEVDGSVLPPAAPLSPGKSRWLTQKQVGAVGEGMPVGLRRMLARMQAFDEDRRRHAAAIAANAAASAADRRAGDEVLDGLLGVADTLAVQFQKRVLLTLRALHWLAALTGICFLVYGELPSGSPAQTLAIYGFLLLFAAGGGVAWLARRRDWHRRYVDYRALAEGLRVQRWWRRAGVGATGPSAFAHEDFMQEQDVELGWIRNVMRAAGIDGADDPQVSDAALDAVIADWIGAPGHGGQLDYFSSKSAQRRRLHASAQALIRACLWGSLAIAACLALFQGWLGVGNAGSLVAVMGVLAIVAAARESYAFRKGDKELAKQYAYMLALFNQARTRLDAASEPGERRAILRVLGEAALAEHSKWALLHRERPLENTRF